MTLRFCLLALFAFSAYAAEPDLSKKKLTGSQITDNCLRESGVRMDQLANNETETLFETERPLQCFGACMYKAYGLTHENATLNVEFIIGKIDNVSPSAKKEKLIQAIRNCATEKGKDDCETFYLTRKCISNYTGFEDEIKFF